MIITIFDRDGSRTIHAGGRGTHLPKRFWAEGSGSPARNETLWKQRKTTKFETDSGFVFGRVRVFRVVHETIVGFQMLLRLERGKNKITST